MALLKNNLAFPLSTALETFIDESLLEINKQNIFAIVIPKKHLKWGGMR